MNMDQVVVSYVTQFGQTEADRESRRQSETLRRTQSDKEEEKETKKERQTRRDTESRTSSLKQRHRQYRYSERRRERILHIKAQCYCSLTSLGGTTYGCRVSVSTSAGSNRALRLTRINPVDLSTSMTCAKGGMERGYA